MIYLSYIIYIIYTIYIIYIYIYIMHTYIHIYIYCGKKTMQNNFSWYLKFQGMLADEDLY